MVEPENLVLALPRDMRSDMQGIGGYMEGMRAEIADARATMATKDDPRSEINSLRADIASDMVLLEKRLSDRISHSNRAVMESHSSAIGHGILFSEVDERVRRIERHLTLAPPDARRVGAVSVRQT